MKKFDQGVRFGVVEKKDPGQICSVSAVSSLDCYTAVFRVVTQRSSSLTAAENRTTFLSRD